MKDAGRRIAKNLAVFAGLGLLLVTGGGRAGAGRAGAEREVKDGRFIWEEFKPYVVGYGGALVLTLAAFGLVHWHLARGQTAFGILVGLAVVQIVVHFRCFLHIGLRKAARDDLQLILFSALVAGLMVGGTLVILFNLRMRMM